MTLDERIEKLGLYKYYWAIPVTVFHVFMGYGSDSIALTAVAVFGTIMGLMWILSIWEKRQKENDERPTTDKRHLRCVPSPEKKS